jgi:hypothetical protein
MSDLFKVEPGILVRIELTYEFSIEQLEFIIVPDDQADFSAGFLGVGTPLAQAILDKTVGSQVPYMVGDASSVRVLSISKTDKVPSQDVVGRREERKRQVIEQSDRTSAMIFASSFSGKWGDYDPQGIEAWDEQDSSDNK